jgi:hypothetical protein
VVSFTPLEHYFRRYSPRYLLDMRQVDPRAGLNAVKRKMRRNVALTGIELRSFSLYYSASALSTAMIIQ